MEYKPLEKNLEDGLSQLGNQIRGIPHIVIGRDKPNNQENNTQNNNPPNNEPLFNKKESEIINKIRKIGLIIAVTAIIGYAVWRIFS